ncbi:hypothetical protein GJV06_00510 [Enterobacteriaceae bacterium RIT691]|nr:hypothetical protein [Enterobacteriaceae bacterium RIT691]
MTIVYIMLGIIIFLLAWDSHYHSKMQEYYRVRLDKIDNDFFYMNRRDEGISSDVTEMKIDTQSDIGELKSELRRVKAALNEIQNTLNNM